MDLAREIAAGAGSGETTMNALQGAGVDLLAVVFREPGREGHPAAQDH